MNPWAILAALALYGGTFTYAVWERADAIKARADISTLEASYATKAAAAVTHAKAMEAADLADLNRQSAQALRQAQTQTATAQSQLQAYLAKGKQSKQTDMGHAWFYVAVPVDELPGQT